MSQGSSHEDEAPKAPGLRPEAMSSLLKELLLQGTAKDQPSRGEPRIGSMVGRFELVKELGRGGFGVVYEARDVQLQRSVAVKLLRVGETGLGEQLQREAELVARLSHPNLVTLFDVGLSEQGPYLVLELLKGQTLQQRLDAGPMPVAEAVRIAVEAARGLAYAHGEGVVHRDLKPSNVFITTRGAVKLLDFGMAHAFGRRRVSGGTPAYMAPEQWEEAPEDERTDVFALGVMLHRMLTGEYPYGEQGGKWSSGPAEAASLDVPGALELGGLVGRMLERGPTKRPRDGAEVLAALEAIEESLPAAAPAPVKVTRKRASLADLVAELKRRRVFRVMAAYGIFSFAVLQVIEPIMHGAHLPDWVLTATLVALVLGFPVAVILSWVFDVTSEGVRRTPTAKGAVTLSRTRLVALLSGVAILAAFPGFGWYAWKARGERRAGPGATDAIRLAVLPLANLSGDASQDFFSDGLTEEITGKLSRLRGLAVTSRSTAAKAAASRKGAREAGLELGVAYVVEGSVRRTGDRLRVTASLVKTADATNAWSESIDARLDDLFDVQERVASRIVEALHLRLSPDEVSDLGRWGTRNVAAYDEYLRGQVLVEHFSKREKLEAARGHFARALEIDPGFAPAMAGLASAEAQTYRNVDSDSTRLARARELAERALAIDPRLTRALFTSGELRAVSFDYLGAERVFRKVLEIEPRSYQAWDYLCWSLGYQTPPRAAEAESACRRAIEINPGYAESYYHLARALLPQGRVPDAEEALRQLAEHVPDSGLIPFGSYWVQMASGRPGDALTTLETHLPFEKTALRMASTAMALSMMGRRDQAFQVLEQALRTGYRDGAALLGNPYFEPLRSDPRFVRLLADSGLGPGGSAPPPPSIAVLPFADMSPGHDQEYFADGVAEEILNALAHVEGLKVIARTSSFSFKGKNDDLRRIGQQLDVAHVLEGSLRKDGDQIRVTAQLIRVADGSHVWSETYDRRLTGIFKVQDEIARAVVTRLKGALLPGFSAPAERQGTTPAAYEQYLIGLHGGGESREGYQVGLAAFERAVALDPDYAPAWAELASNIFWNLAIYGGDRKAGLARAAMAAERAVRLGPGLASAFLARGLLRSHVDWDWKGSQADFERALTLDPGSSLAKRRYGVLLCELGRLEEAVPWLEGAVALDPLSAGSWNAVGSNFVDLGRFDQARRALQRGLAVRPNHVLLTQNLGDIDLLEGRPQAALDLYRTINSESYRLEGEAMALHTLGRHAESRQALAILEARFGESNPTMVAEVNAWRGDREAAFRWLDRAAAVHDTGLRELKDNRYLKSLRADPRYKALLRTMKLPVD